MNLDPGSPGCCRQLPTARPAASPFGEVICLDYYDGPVSGITRCTVCETAYVFRLLEWDQGQDVRVFSLAALPPSSFLEAVAICSKLGAPRWPVWVLPWESRATGQLELVDRTLQAILDRADSPGAIVASDDVGKSILAFRALPAGTSYRDAEAESGGHWLAWLGIARQAAAAPPV